MGARSAPRRPAVSGPRAGLALFAAFAATACLDDLAAGDDLAGDVLRVRVTERDVAAAPGEPAASALAYASRRARALGAGGDLEVARVARGPADSHYVRLRQRHGALRVWGADVVVHVTGDEVAGLFGALSPASGSRPPVPRIDRDRAIAIAKRGHANDAGARSIDYARARAELVAFPEGGDVRPAWEVELFAERQPGLLPARPYRLIDAATGDTLWAYDALAAAAKGSGPGGNARVARHWDEALKVSPSCGGFQMSTSRLQTVDMGGRSTGDGAIVEGPLDCVGGRAANDAHGFASISLDMLAAWMERDSIDDAGEPIRSRVNYSVDYANAFWDGEQVTYGDGGSRFYPLSGDPTVVAHEIHHGFTERHSGLLFAGQAGALNESFSDVAAVAVAYYLDGRHGTSPGFAIGADVTRAPGDALRDVCDPRRDGRSIDHADDYEPGMFLHVASGVPNRAFCLAAHELSGGGEGGAATAQGVRRAARAWFEANVGFWTRSTGFVDGCRGVLDAAEALGYQAWEVDALAAAWAEVGVDCLDPAPAGYSKETSGTAWAPSSASK